MTEFKDGIEYKIVTITFGTTAIYSKDKRAFISTMEKLIPESDVIYSSEIIKSERKICKKCGEKR